MSSADTPLPSRYDFKQVEEKLYNTWLREGYFTGKKDSKKPPYGMVIPPPNVTGRLHMGHALNNTIQDILVRFKRMTGHDVVWIPGTDHAGISTQSVVKKHLLALGKDPNAMSKDAFIQSIFEWKDKYGNIILEQLKRLGCSCDWTRQRFTMDALSSKATRHAFKRLYDDGLIYKGKRIVNWCPVDQTALSDDEVLTEEKGEDGFLYQIDYPVIGQNECVIVSTTRPETLFGDVAVAVHPNDKRYQKFIGKSVKLPLTDRKIPIIKDESVKQTSEKVASK